VNHLTTNQLFSSCQFGFRNKRSCVLQLLDVFDDLTWNYDNGHQTDIVYLGIKKAFDTVRHRRLLLKLKSYGFEGKLLSWIENFLMNRRQSVFFLKEKNLNGRMFCHKDQYWDQCCL